MELSIPVPVPELPNVIPAHPCLTVLKLILKYTDLLVSVTEQINRPQSVIFSSLNLAIFSLLVIFHTLREHRAGFKQLPLSPRLSYFSSLM